MSGDRRRHLPDERPSITHKVAVAGHEIYLVVGLFADGSPGEIFVHTGKEGSTVSGWADAWAVGISTQLQYGVPLAKIVEKMRNARFEPAGRTSNPAIPDATSMVDYVGRWLEAKFAKHLDAPVDAPATAPVAEKVEASEGIRIVPYWIGKDSREKRSLLHRLLELFL